MQGPEHNANQMRVYILVLALWSLKCNLQHKLCMRGEGNGELEEFK